MFKNVLAALTILIIILVFDHVFFSVPGFEFRKSTEKKFLMRKTINQNVDFQIAITELRYSTVLTCLSVGHCINKLLPKCQINSLVILNSEYK